MRYAIYEILLSAAVFCVCVAELSAFEPQGPWQKVPTLPAPKGNVVKVQTEAELQRAVQNLKSGTTVLISPGTYKLTNTLHVRGELKNIAIRGATGNRNDVVIQGKGMRNKQYGNVPHGILVADATDVLIADLSIGDVWFHPITLQGQQGCDRVRIYNVRLFEAGEQFLKANPAGPDGAKGGVDEGIVEYCVFEYKDTARHWYTEGVDVHTGTGWIVRNNLFRNIRGPKGAKNIGGAIDFWNRSKDTLVENNVIWNCAVGIRLGVLDRNGYQDHSGGMIRNNVIVRFPDACHWADAGIIVNDSPGTKVLHNTVLLHGTYANAIEYRFPSSMKIEVIGNLCDAAIRARDGAQGIEANNFLRAVDRMFVDLPNGDWHLSGRIQGVVDMLPTNRECPKDIDGDKRVGKADIGADEFVLAERKKYRVKRASPERP